MNSGGCQVLSCSISDFPHHAAKIMIAQILSNYIYNTHPIYILDSLPNCNVPQL